MFDGRFDPVAMPPATIAQAFSLQRFVHDSPSLSAAPGESMTCAAFHAHMPTITASTMLPAPARPGKIAMLHEKPPASQEKSHKEGGRSSKSAGLHGNLDVSTF